ncbi:hypothetical protein D1BOALGB6SA_30 [Olavius sp. associated proteobacterium Delta 1]|nr:hypothetical protein D1BOALGB6SA_30 [Olavius sp. associated proteobacterium Delta 1]
MKDRLLQWLVCPDCAGGLTLAVYRRQDNEVNEGTLQCQCGQIFPIIGGVPRLLCDPLSRNLPRLYPDFFQRHSDLLENQAKSAAIGVSTGNKATIDRFGYEWLHFSDYNCDNFDQFVASLPAEFFNGKLGLDVGCGAGRHVRQASRLGAEVIGIDLSHAVDAAHLNNIDNDRVHIVQADVYNLPFNNGIFQFIYSLGVLHHLPDPERGYRALPALLSKGGSLFIWVYAYALRKVALELLRFISQRLSNHNVRRMAYLCNLIDYGIFINTYRLLANLPLAGISIKRHSPLRVKEYANYGFSVGYTDWFDRLSAPITNYYRENEMQAWLQHGGLCKTVLRLEGDSWWWLYGERKA